MKRNRKEKEEAISDDTRGIDIVETHGKGHRNKEDLKDSPSEDQEVGGEKTISDKDKATIIELLRPDKTEEEKDEGRLSSSHVLASEADIPGHCFLQVQFAYPILPCQSTFHVIRTDCHLVDPFHVTDA